MASAANANLNAVRETMDGKDRLPGPVDTPSPVVPDRGSDQTM